MDTKVRVFDGDLSAWEDWINIDGYIQQGGCVQWSIDICEDVSAFYDSRHDSVQFAWDIMDNSNPNDFCRGKHKDTDYRIDNVSVGFYGHDPSAVSEDWTPPKAFRLECARPNPFNPTTTFEYAVPRPCNVQIAVFSVDGRRIRQLISGVVPGGTHNVTWDGRDDRGQQVASGLYFCRMEAGSYCRTIRMAIVK
jgi:hypothetical protein